VVEAISCQALKRCMAMPRHKAHQVALELRAPLGKRPNSRQVDHRDLREVCRPGALSVTTSLGNLVFAKDVSGFAKGDVGLTARAFRARHAHLAAWYHKDMGCDLSWRDDLLTRGKTAQFDQGQKTVGFPLVETAPTPSALDS